MFKNCQFSHMMSIVIFAIKIENMFAFSFVTLFLELDPDVIILFSS